MCSFGINYQRVDSRLLVAGVVLEDWQPASQARRKRLREARAARAVVSRQAFDRAVAAYGARRDEQDALVAEDRARVQDQSVEDEVFKKEFLQQFQRDLQKGLMFVHDYKQINAQISQNINVLLESRYPGATQQEKLERAHHAERAIYYAAKFLEEKLNVAKFLLTPDWLYQPSECTRFRVHGLVIKYVRIYQYWFEQKNIHVNVIGESYNEIVANPQACAVIPHTFIDNALKYAPRGTRVEIDVQDEGGHVFLAVGSYGPRLLPGEEKRIFRPFYRGEHARRVEEEGAGYGLYVSQLIAKKHFGTTITVQQDLADSKGEALWTTFEITLPDKAKILL